ncbi:hypothetical protein Tco_0043975 [Tanacetum coccineum]
MGKGVTLIKIDGHQALGYAGLPKESDKKFLLFHAKEVYGKKEEGGTNFSWEAKYIITCLGSRSPTDAGAERPQDFNGRKGNGWSTIESRGLFRSRISGKIGLIGALVIAREEEEVSARIEAKGCHEVTMYLDQEESKVPARIEAKGGHEVTMYLDQEESKVRGNLV